MLPIIYDGSGQPLPERITLCAGALSLVYEAGMLRWIQLGNHNLVHGIYAAVRDENWGTISAELSDVKLDSRADSFDLSFTCTHRQDDIHFVWRSIITGSADSTISFSFDGEALSTFKRNRVGFCVLHPMDAAGKHCEIKYVDDSVENSTFPQFISPHQPFFNIRSITHEVLPDVRVEVCMEGDTFEMEDQRNWTDASFKTYCSPLALPFPVTLEAGTKIQQKISLRLIGQPPQTSVSENALTLAIDTHQAVPLPPIGLGYAGETLTPSEIAKLKMLRPAHLRVELRCGDELETQLRQFTAVANAITCSLEIALYLGQDVDADLRRLCTAVNDLQPPVARWFIFRAGEQPTSRETIIVAKNALAAYGAPIGSGTDAYFTELNRNRPHSDLLDWVCFSVNPQVHAFDNASLIETFDGQAATLTSARTFSANANIAVSPITLKPRWNPATTTAASNEAHDVLPRRVDVRQLSLFAAVWTLGSIKALSSNAANSLTYYETSGWLGVMERESGSALLQKFPSEAGDVFPLYHVLADVNEFARGEVLAVSSSEPQVFDALALQKDGKIRLLVANYTPYDQKITITGLSGRFFYKSLDETTAEQASHAPDIFRAAQGDKLEASESGFQLALKPYAVVRLDHFVD